MVNDQPRYCILFGNSSAQLAVFVYGELEGFTAVAKQNNILSLDLHTVGKEAVNFIFDFFVDRDHGIYAPLALENDKARVCGVRMRAVLTAVERKLETVFKLCVLCYVCVRVRKEQATVYKQRRRITFTVVDQIEILVVGGGPAGLCAALAASSLGAKVLICERDDHPGGQLVKQTHKFFGSEKQYAGDRGFQIGEMLLEKVKADENIELWIDTTVLGIYEDGIVTCEHDGEHVKIKPERTIIATGAAEKFLPFPGNDLPGIYGAGAVQTLMNVSGVKPAERVLMVGAGNIGLIVSYQLKQAGVDIAAIIEGAPKIGGYLVHASKDVRSGIPVLTSHTILEAYGKDRVEGAIIAKIDDKWQPIPGTEQDIKCDVICLAVGLSPLTELCWQAGCEMAFIRELSGHVPIVDDYLETTVPGIYVAGDVSGIEEASSAMVEGRLAGLSAAASLGYGKEEAPELQKAAMAELDELRAGPMGERIRMGLEKVAAKGGAK